MTVKALSCSCKAYRTELGADGYTATTNEGQAMMVAAEGQWFGLFASCRCRQLRLNGNNGLTKRTGEPNQMEQTQPRACLDLSPLC